MTAMPMTGLKQRQIDAPHDLPTGRAVDARRVDDAARQGTQAREQQQRHERRPLPEVDEDQAWQGERGIRGPCRLGQMQEPEQVVDRAELVVEQLHPLESGDRGRDDRRDQKKRRQQVLMAAQPVEKNGEAESDRELQQTTPAMNQAVTPRLLQNKGSENDLLEVSAARRSDAERGSGSGSSERRPSPRRSGGRCCWRRASPGKARSSASRSARPVSPRRRGRIAGMETLALVMAERRRTAPATGRDAVRSIILYACGVSS